MTNPCQKHTHWSYAGIYKRNKYGQLKRDKKGARILLLPEEVWACPHCNVVFINPHYKKRFKTRPLRRQFKHGKLNNRTVSKVLR